MLVKVLFKNNDQEVTGYLDQENRTLEVAYKYTVQDNKSDPRRLVSEDGTITTYNSGGFYFDKGSIIEAKVYSEELDFKATLIGLSVVYSSHKGLMLDRTVQKMKYSYIVKDINTSYDDEVFDSLRFSFNEHSKYSPLHDVDSVQVCENSVTVNTAETLVWEKGLEDEKTLSLIDSLKKQSYYSVPPVFDRELIFEIKSKSQRISISTAFEYINKVKQLLSISAFNNETIKSVRLYNGCFEYNVDTPKETALYARSPRFLQYQDLSADHYAKWIINSNALSPYPSILLESLEHEDENAIRLLLSSLLSLSDKTLKGDIPRDDGKKISKIICSTDPCLGKSLIGTEVSCKDLGKRLRDGRTYWMHQILEENLSSVARDEMSSHLVLIRYVFILSCLNYCGIKIKGHINQGWIQNAKNITNGYGGWAKLNEIRINSEQYQKNRGNL